MPFETTKTCLNFEGILVKWRKPYLFYAKKQVDIFSGEIKVGCLYEIDHQKLPPKSPIQLKAIRMVMVRRTQTNPLQTPLSLILLLLLLSIDVAGSG